MGMDEIELTGTAGETLVVEGEADADGEVEFCITVEAHGGDFVDASAYLNHRQRRALVAHLNRIDKV